MPILWKATQTAADRAHMMNQHWLVQGKLWSKSWGKLAAVVVLAHVLVVLYVLLGSKRGGASVTGLLSGQGVRARVLGNTEANTTKWLQEVGTLCH